MSAGKPGLQLGRTKEETDAKRRDELIRMTYELGKATAQKGNGAFGSLLALDEEVLLTAENTVNSEHDCTAHAEMNLIRAAWRSIGPETLGRCEIYVSAEPCVMCSGAIHWAGIKKVVFGCSVEALGKITGDQIPVRAQDILRLADHSVRVDGPILEEEGLLLHLEAGA